jgi:Protein of unknown function (DUF1549)/Protein of unknown function (DUF1553)/Bacterial Ig-like domain (group 2)
MIRTLFTITICVAFASSVRAVDLPGGGKVEKVDFERHIMGLMSKVGCNLGSCHGSFQGKNGFRVSLFGYDPEYDHKSIARDNLGRRVNVTSPDDSLLLLKGSGRMTHEGGMRFGKDSWVYNTFREWIAQGATWTAGSGSIVEMTVTPKDFAVVKEGQEKQLTVRAKFADGTEEEITPFCDFKITDDAIAAVSPTGLLTARKPGDAGLAILYRGTVRAVRVLVPAPGKPGEFPKPVNELDREVFAKLKLLNMTPSELSGDLEFLRRVTIDTTAQLPTPDEIRAFLADKSPNKREKKIDELLAHPLHAALWATKLSDITGNNTDALETNQQPLKAKRSQMWHDWLRKRMADNVPYDKLVRDILTATTADGMKPEEWIAFTKKVDEQIAKGNKSDYPEKKTLDIFWRRQQQVQVEIWGEKVAAAFLGVRLECAQCHKHPTDRWTQEEYWAFANIFGQVTFNQTQFSTPEAKKLATEENDARKAKVDMRQANNINLVREVIVVDRGARMKPNPATNRVPTPRTLGGPEVMVKPGVDARVQLADWLTTKENPFFARSFANRVWAHYFGIGLVNPVDDFSLANPPTNPRLLERLAQEFTDGGFDLRKLEKAILMGRAYQTTAKTNSSNVFDRMNFARSYVRPLMAEQVVDVLNAALGVDEVFGVDAPAGYKMVEVGASRLNASPNLTYILRIFGRPPRTTACDCERSAEPALPQTLFRMTDPGLLLKMRSPNGRVMTIAKKKLADDATVEEMFLATLSRFPSDREKTEALKFLQENTNKGEALADVMWALINTREFILNH